MAGLLGGLINASKSLAAHEAGVQTAGRNLANVNNPNYARQRVILGDKTTIETALGTTGSGVEALGIEQIRDALLDAGVSREIAQSALLKAQQSALERAEANLGETIDSSSSSSSIGDNTHATNGISSAVNDFFNAWEELSARPADTAARQLLLQKATTLADKLNVSDTRLANLQGDLTTQINTDLTRANGILQTVADLNAQIAQVEMTHPGGAIDMRDQRQAKLEALAGFTDFTAREIPGSHGQIEIVSHDAGGAEVQLLSKTTVRPLAFDGTNFTSGTPPTTLALKGGSLQGSLTVRDGAVQGVRDQLAALAQQLTTSVNTAYNPGGTGQDFFQAAPTGGKILAVNASITAANLQPSTSGASADNDIALAIAALASKKFSTTGGDVINGTPIGFLSDTISGLGAKLNDVSTKLEDQSIVQTMVTQQRDSVSGVSMDEELADLMKFQRAYQANSKVIATLDSMLGDLMNTLNR